MKVMCYWGHILILELLIIELLKDTQFFNKIIYKRIKNNHMITLQKKLYNLHPQGGDSKVLQNTGILPQHYNMSQPRKPQHKYSLPCKPQISCIKLFFQFYKSQRWVKCSKITSQTYEISSCVLNNNTQGGNDKHLWGYVAK